MSKYGFSVEHITKSWRDDSPKDKWRVYLPHSCDEWVISTSYEDEFDHDVAVRDLELFIEEAQLALEKLKNKQELIEDE